VILAGTQLLAQSNWHRTGVPVCGKVTIREDGKNRAGKNQVIQLFKPEDKDAPCCEKAKFAFELKTDRSAKFLIRTLEAGEYFLVLSSTQQHLTIPIQVPKSYESRTCGIDQHFTVDAATGKSEVTVMVELRD
jgi:hypothetical protein